MLRHLRQALPSAAARATALPCGRSVMAVVLYRLLLAVVATNSSARCGATVCRNSASGSILPRTHAVMHSRHQITPHAPQSRQRAPARLHILLNTTASRTPPRIYREIVQRSRDASSMARGSLARAYPGVLRNAPYMCRCARERDSAGARQSDGAAQVGVEQPAGPLAERGAAVARAEAIACTRVLGRRHWVTSMDVHGGLCSLWNHPHPSVMAKLNKALTASRGGVAANKSSLYLILSSLATRRERYLGFLRSPLLISTQRTPIGLLPVLSQHSVMGTLT